MITETEIAWLRTRYPNLSVNSDRTEISGEIIFAAAYDEATNTFTPLTLPGQTAPGLTLRGSYRIAIKKRENPLALPALYVLDGKVDPIADRHFYGNHSGCLCGPVEEMDFMMAGFSLEPYIERLVYPFLYAQLFYEKHEEWPWPDYPHGVAGIFESYYRSGSTREHAEVCLRRMPSDFGGWPRAQAALQGKEKVNGGDPCFCSSKHKIRDHLVVWRGLMKLKKDIAAFGVPLDKQGSDKDAPSK